MRWVSEVGLSSQSSSGSKGSSLGTEAAEPTAWGLRAIGFLWPALKPAPGPSSPLQLPEPLHLLVFLLCGGRQALLVLGREFSAGLLGLLAVRQILGRQLLVLSLQPLFPLLVRCF